MRRPERWQQNDAERMNRTWNAIVRDGEIAAGRDDDDPFRVIARLHARDDAPHVEPGFADRLLHRLIAQHPATTPIAARHQNTTVNRSTTMQQQLARGVAKPSDWSAPSPRRTLRRLPGALLGPGWTDLVAIAAVVMLVFSAVLADRGRSSIGPPATEAGFQVAAATPATVSADETGNSAMYRGNAARTGELPGPGPAGPPTLAWEQGGGSRTVANLVSADGRVFYAAYSEQTDTYDLAAADLDTGEELWRAPIDVDFFSAPAVMDGIIYVGAGSGLKVIGVDVETGDVAWTYQFAAPGTLSPPVVHEGIVYIIGPDFVLYALDAIDAETLWGFQLPGTSAEAGGFVTGTTNIAVADDKVFGRGNDGIVFALDIRNGEVVWTTTLEGAADEAFLVSDGVVAVTAIDFSDAEGPKPVRLHALDPETGDAMWEPVKLTSPSSLAAADGTLFVADSLEDTGTVDAYDIQTGESLWAQELGGSLTSPVYVDGQLYVLSGGDGIVRRIDASTGTVNWSVYLGTRGDPLVADGLVLAAGDERLYAVAGDDGQGTPPPAEDPFDLSGLPSCEPPRTPPAEPLTGEPAATIDVESRPLDDSGASGPPTTIDGRPVELTSWPFILAANVPTGEPATSAQIDGVEETIAAMADCSRRPGSEPRIAGFFSDDFYRRGIVTPGSGTPLTWSIQPDEEQLHYLDVFVLEDGRIAASTVTEWGSGTFMVFVDVDGARLVDEVYQVSPEYPVSA